MRAWPLLMMLAAACAAVPAATPPARPPLVAGTAQPRRAPPPPPQANGRLPALARPLRYALDLHVDPARPRFTGEATILLQVPAPTRYVVMNGRDLHVTAVTLRTGAREMAGTASSRPAAGSKVASELVLAFPQPLPAGRATLTVDYDAPFGDALSGLYRVKDGGRWYAFTQFEAVDARRAFPCFDEPSFKTPFDVSVTVPGGMIAVANAPEKAREPGPGGTTFRFATTPPLPSYLVALAVGDLDVREGKKTPVPVRVITTKGKSALGTQALAAAADLVALLGDYFGIRYPYEKLDVVAVPDFAAGAMENAGLVTFREEALLLGEHPSVQARRRLVGIVAHELSHQWFGDLVTMRWWDDLWLNEGFATWMATKISARYEPAMRAGPRAAASAEWVKDQDGLVSARAIRQPVSTVAQAMDAFDGITYDKGAAVLRMLEHTVGEDAFQKGVREYLRAHAWGNARADDLLAALDHVSGKDTRAVAAAFLDRPGVPDVVVDETRCAAGGWHLRAHEERWRPLGSALDAGAHWRVPICAQSATKGDAACGALTDTPLVLDGKGPCPLVVNPGATTYARVALPKDALEALFAPSRGRAPFEALDVPTRIATLGSAWAEVRSGRLDAGAFLGLLHTLDAETDRYVVQEEIAILYALRDATVDDATQAAFARFAAARLRPHDLRLWRVKSPLDGDGRLLRRSVDAALVELAGDKVTLARLAKVASTHQPADPDLQQLAREVAGRSATVSDLPALRQAVAKAATPEDRVTALRAAAAVTDPAAVRAQLDWMVSGAVKTQDVHYVLGTLAWHRASRDATLAWARAHWDALRARLPGPLARGLVSNAGYACTRPDLDEARAFYTQKARDIEGTERPLAQALEQASLCVALREAAGPAVRKALGVTTASAAAAPARR